MRRFPFVQFELTHGIGPAPGRYLVHPYAEARARHADDGPGGAAVLDELDGIVPSVGPPDEPAAAAPTVATASPATAPARTGYEVDSALLGTADVVVIRTVGAPPPKAGLFGRKGAPPVAPGETPRELAITMATVIFGTRLLPDEQTTRRFFAGVQGEPDQRDQWVQAALVIINRAIAAYRACAADPYVVELTTLDPRAIRIGYGPAELVSVGKWEQAIAVPPPPPIRLSRDQRVMPTQAMAGVLTEQGEVLEAEELLLRAVLDLEQGRVRAAAVGFEGAFSLLLGELSGRVLAGSVRTKLEALVDEPETISALGATARRGPLGEREVERLEALVESTGALVDHWRYAALGYV